MTKTGSVGLALARICVSFEFVIKNNCPTNGLIFIQFTLEAYNLHLRIALKFDFRYIIILMKGIIPLVASLQK